MKLAQNPFIYVWLIIVTSISLFFCCQYDLHMTRRWHVRVNSTVSTVCSSAHLWRSVDLDVANNELFNVQTLDISICLGVAKKVEDVLGRLSWPSTLSPLVLLALSLSAHTTIVASEWDDFFLCNNILQKLLSSAKRHAGDGFSCLTCVLGFRRLDVRGLHVAFITTTFIISRTRQNLPWSGHGCLSLLLGKLLFLNLFKFVSENCLYRRWSWGWNCWETYICSGSVVR